MRKWVLRGCFLSILIVPALLIFVFFSVQNFYTPGPLKYEKTLVITAGQSLTQISQALAKENIISQAWLFSWNVRLRSRGNTLRAGEYYFPPHISPQEIFSKISKGICIIHQFTVVEGMTAHEVICALNRREDLKNVINQDVKEGELLPETYYYTFNDDRNALIQRMRDAMTQTLAKLWATRDRTLPLTTPYQALILASIIEKETSLEQERPHISGVFINRLEKRMPLQSDPTVAYGCFYLENKSIKILSYAELKKSTPYNTYLNLGLPPTPICNPGRKAIEAALHPLKTEDLYFVADGTGGHVFSKTYEDHKKHHQYWRHVLKQRHKL